MERAEKDVKKKTKKGNHRNEKSATGEHKQRSAQKTVPEARPFRRGVHKSKVLVYKTLVG